MYPVNQVFVGGDPLLSPSSPINSIPNIDEQIQYLQKQRQIIEAAQQQKLQPQPKKLIWDDIDAEIAPMSNEQKAMLFQNEEYSDIYNKLQVMVQTELLNLVKGRIENTEEGRELLNAQLKLVKKLKSSIVDSTNREMEIFRSFKEFSKQNPNITYDEFIKLSLNSNGNKQSNK